MTTTAEGISTETINLIAEYITAIKLAKPGETITFGFDSFATMESNLKAMGLTEDHLVTLTQAAR